MGEKMMIEVRDLKQYFRINDSYTVKAVDGISFYIREGEVFGLVGESGCGKSTVARSLTGIYKPTEGEVIYDGIPVTGKGADKAKICSMQHEIQTIFQDSAAALNPRMTVEKIILEPYRIQRLKISKEEQRKKLVEMIHNVGISETYLTKTPGELSGGQRQRVSIARALMLNPRLIIADEPVASLDISIQAQIITLFQRLQKEEKFSFFFIAHDLSVVRFISDRIAVMLRGKIVEIAETEELFSNPLHPYTKSLLSAIHVPDPIYERNKKMIYYDTDIPLGDHLVEVSSGHFLLQ
ncbi:MAG: ATP-binding cassette domain-containing protein [Lachnospiraceae bacterium]|nr:ATP-binding cassette domain-containing protein [Lachnospiraceae bacterium]